MSVCDSCHKAKPIIRCLTNIIVGTISSANTAVYVVFNNLTTGRKIRYAVTSSAAGLITVPVTPQVFSVDHSYEITVVKASAVNISERENITIQGDVSDCINLRFDNLLSNANAQASETNQTLTLEPA